MKLTFKHKRNSIAVFIALTLSGCTRFDTRMQANGTFEYVDARLETPYLTGDFTNDEARENYAIPSLTDQQKRIGFTTTDVDIRPPTQFTPVIDGVILDEANINGTKIWFNAFKQNDDIEDKVWTLIEDYLAQKNVTVNKNDTSNEIETGLVVDNFESGSLFSKNKFVTKASYRLAVEKQLNGHSVALTVDALSYQETNDSKSLKFDLLGDRKNEIETRFINKLLEFAYQVKESEQLDRSDKQPLAIKLGFDDNHQIAWIVKSEFLDTWSKIPSLLTLLNFDVIEKDKNLGYFLLRYNKPAEKYWQAKNLNPFELDEAEYFVQLGELTGGVTSISWLDEDKKPLPDQKIVDLYLSITDHLRDALDKKNNEF